MIRPGVFWTTALLLALALGGCSRSGGGDDEESSASTAVPDVTVVKVKRELISGSLSVSGNLGALPNRDAKVSALVPGRIARVLVVEGDRVKDGQPLAELDTILLRQQEAQAKAAVAQARANLENANLAFQREQGLLGRGISSRKEVEDARTQVSVNTAALNQAEATLATAKAGTARAVVRAPFAGTVVKRFVSVGEQVDGTAAQPIAEVADIQALELLGTVPASQLSEVKTGESFEFSSSAVPGEKFSAKVVAVLPAVDPATNNGTVRIRIDNPMRLLKFGQFITLDLPLNRSGPRLVVPRQSIYPDESGEPRVYKVTGDEAQSVPVTLGVETADKVEIVSGVKEGDTVVLNGGYGLPDRSKVHVKS